MKRKFQNLIRFGLALRDAGAAALISVLDDLTLDLPSAWEGSLHFLAAPVTPPDSVDTDDINAFVFQQLSQNGENISDKKIEQ